MIRLALAAALCASPAIAHEAVSGWAYDASCCSNRDCDVVAVSTVSITPDGYLVTLRPGDHPLVTETITRLFRYIDADPMNNGGAPKEARQSQDEDFHACVTPRGNFLCLYAPDFRT